jgi:hypothetical protein
MSASARSTKYITGFVAPYIKCQSLGFLGNCGIETRFGRIVDVKQIPTLLAPQTSKISPSITRRNQMPRKVC